MANECNGRWKTKLFYRVKDGVHYDPPQLPLEVDDGVNEIEIEDGQGNVTGKHHKTGDKIKGKCAHGAKHILSFDRPEGPNTFKYKNGEVDGDKISGGDFKVVGPPPPPGAGPPGEGDSGTWESNREGSPGPTAGDEHGHGQGEGHGQGFNKGGGAREVY